MPRAERFWLALDGTENANLKSVVERLNSVFHAFEHIDRLRYTSTRMSGPGLEAEVPLRELIRKGKARATEALGRSLAPVVFQLSARSPCSGV